MYRTLNHTLRIAWWTTLEAALSLINIYMFHSRAMCKMQMFAYVLLPLMDHSKIHSASLQTAFVYGQYLVFVMDTISAKEYTNSPGPIQQQLDNKCMNTGCHQFGHCLRYTLPVSMCIYIHSQNTPFINGYMYTQLLNWPGSTEPSVTGQPLCGMGTVFNAPTPLKAVPRTQFITWPSSW